MEHWRRKRETQENERNWVSEIVYLPYQNPNCFDLIRSYWCFVFYISCWLDFCRMNDMSRIFLDQSFPLICRDNVSLTTFGWDIFGWCNGINWRSSLVFVTYFCLYVLSKLSLGLRLSDKNKWSKWINLDVVGWRTKKVKEGGGSRLNDVLILLIWLKCKKVGLLESKETKRKSKKTKPNNGIDHFNSP